MAGKHRKTSRPGVIVAMVVAPAGVAAAAMAAGSLTNVEPADTTVAAPPPSIDLLALVSAANSTSQFFAGSNYYGTDWTTVYGTQQVVPFFQGPQGLADAIASHQNDKKATGITASGWGAGQAGTALGIAADNGDLDNVDLVILDNNTNRAGGGFWTTYYPFAPLLATTADPTPTDLPENVTVLDVAYEYNINGNAAVDPLNPFALGNSLAAYIYGYGAESTAADITHEEGGPVVLHDVDTTGSGITPVDADGDGVKNDVEMQKGKHYVVKDGKVTVYDAPGTTDNPNNSTIYVTIDSGELPLTRPLRLLPGGDILADAIDPTMTALVDAGYNDGKGTADDPAIPKDPTVTRPMLPGSSLAALGDVPGTVPVGLQEGVETAQEDIADPGNFVNKPLAEFGKLPVLSSLGNLAGAVNPSTAKQTPGVSKPATPSIGGQKPLKQFTDRINEAVKQVTGGGLPSLKKPADDDPE